MNKDELLRRGKFIIYEKYKNILCSGFKLREKLDQIEIRINKDIKYPAQSTGTWSIQFKRIERNKEENLLLIIHEILHIIFTNKSIHNLKKNLAENRRIVMNECFLQDLLDSFLDLQIKQFTNFDKSVWSNLKESKNPPYFTDLDIINLFDKFISETYIDKKLINLEPLILEFINKNLSLILSKYDVKQHNNIN